MKVLLRISRIVVHGAAAIEHEAFARALENKIASRLSIGGDATTAAECFKSAPARQSVARFEPIAAETLPDVVASALLGKSVR